MQYLFAALIFMSLACGYGFKKNWLLWLSAVFWFPLGIYLMLYNPITNLSSWVWLLVIPLWFIPTLFDILSNQLKTNATKDSTGEFGNEDSSDTDEYDVNNDYRQWKKKTGYFRSKRKNRYLKGLK